MRASHQNKSSVIGAVLVEVDEALEAAKTGSFRVLVLMRPSLVGWGILAVGPLNVDDVEGDDEVFGTVNSAIMRVTIKSGHQVMPESASSLFEGPNDSRLASNFPNPVLVTDAIVLDH